jgi:hypothetical protein
MTLHVDRGILFSAEFWKKQVCSGKTLLSAMECLEKITFPLMRCRDERAGTGVNIESVGVGKFRDQQKVFIKCCKRWTKFIFRHLAGRVAAHCLYAATPIS